MKRVLCLLCLVLLFLVAACAGEEADPPPRAGGTEGGEAPVPSPTPDPTPVPSTPLPDDATTGTRIRARGFLIVGMRYDLPPFGYVTEEGEVDGFSVELGRELTRRWLGVAQQVKFRQVRSDTAVEHLQARDVDIVVTALPHTQEWEAGADFSLPYFIDGQALLVRAADAPVIGDPMGLQGHPVGVVAWGEAEGALRGTVPFTLTFQTYDRFTAATKALSRGEVDAVADLRHRLFWGKHMYPEMAIVGQYTTVPVAFAFRHNDPFFADLVRLTFQDMVADGTYTELYTRWFGGELPPAVERWPGEEVSSRTGVNFVHPEGEVTPSLADAPVVTNVPDTIATIQSRGRLAVALLPGRAPFAYVDTTGTPAGYEISLVRQMAERWLGDGTALDVISATVETGGEMLRTGQADLLVGGIPHTRAAELEMDFSLTTYVAGEGLLVWAGTPITDLVSLRGQQVAVVEGEGSQEALLAAAQEAGVSLTVLPRPTLQSAITLLEEGYVAAVAGERADLLGLVYATPGLSMLPLRLTQVPLAVGLPPAASAFRDLVNLTLQTMKAEGQFDALYATWFDDTPTPLEVWPGVPYRTLRLETSVSEEG